MAKILISSLGTGEKKEGTYKKAKYKIEDSKIYETSFIADALNQHINFDKIFLVGTKKSIWDEAYIALGGKDINYQLELYENKEIGKIDNNILKKFKEDLPKLEPIIIKYGLDEDELWDNFTEFLNISKNINNRDELYLDITHSFRSLSLMSFVMTQFSHTISNKSFKLKAVYYGMFEYQWENNGITPIVDIKLLIEIQEWIKAIDAIKNYSDFNPLVKLLNENSIETDVKNTFINLNNTISIANLTAIKKFIKTASKKIKIIENSKNKIIKLLIPEIKTLVDRLNKEKMSDFQYELAWWFYENKNYALSYIALAEAIVTKSCEKNFPNSECKEKDIREQAKKMVNRPCYWQRDNKDTISEIRNAIAHQLNREGKVKQDILRLEKFLKDLRDYFDKE